MTKSPALVCTHADKLSEQLLVLASIASVEDCIHPCIKSIWIGNNCPCRVHGKMEQNYKN